MTMMAALRGRGRAGRRGHLTAAEDGRDRASSSSRRWCGPCADMPIVHHETFAPILYVLTYETLEEAIAIQNNGRAGTLVGDLHHRPPRGGALPCRRGFRLRHRQRQHRHLGCRDRRGVRRREADRRRPRVGVGLVEGLHAARRPTPSTTPRNYRWRRGCGSTSPDRSGVGVALAILHPT